MHGALAMSAAGITTLVSLKRFGMPELAMHAPQSVVWGPQPARRSTPLLPPCRVTNEGSEVRVRELLEESGMVDDADYLVIDPQNTPPRPELGPLERRVSLAFEEALEQDIFDEEAMQWWFTEPPGGWNTKKRRVKKAPVVPIEGYDTMRHEGADAEGRRPLSQLKVGDVLVGTVVKHMLHHGIQVDVGFEHDGLIWVSELEPWRNLGEHTPEIGTRIEVTVHAVRDDPIFRFPLQFVPTDAELASCFPDPENHIAPLDLREVPMSEYPSVAERSGRKWAPRKVIVPPQIDPLAIDKGEAPWMTAEELAVADDIAAGLL